MSVPSSIKLLKLGNSSSHLSSGRLSTAVTHSVTSKLRQDASQAATVRAVSRPASGSDQYTNPLGDRQHKQNAVRPTGEHAAFASEQLATANRARSSSPVSSIHSSSASFASLASYRQPTSYLLTSSSDRRLADARPLSSIMGSSSSKCTKITDPPSACAANQNAGWLSGHCLHGHNNNHLPPQLNQPFLHHSSSMINLADCVCCQSAFSHHDAALNHHSTSNLYGSSNGKANYLQPHSNCALNVSAHCCPAYANACHFAPHLNGSRQPAKANRDFDSAKDPYWLQQAKKSNKLARKDQKFGLFSRNLLGISDVSQQSKFGYHTKVISGMELLREPGLNKDLAYTHKEREKLGIKGLIPPAVRSQELQARIAIDQFRKLDGSLKKYMYLRDLQDFNKRLFYRLLIEYVEELMPIVYTPVVGDACLKYSELYKRPRGLFITKNDIGHVHEILDNWPEKDIKAIVVTDGERILGLGDLGANGMGIPVGKLALYSALAAIPPHLTLPVTLDVGTNNEKLINSEYYIGLKEPRERGPLYDKLLDEFMEAVVRKWGRTCLIQFEDFGNSNASKLLQKYRNHYCTFNDDIQGTASVAVAGVLAACKRMKKKISQQKFLFMGAGGAALGISDLLVMAMEADGLTTEQAVSNIFLIDSKGLVSKDRENETDQHKMLYAKQLPNYQDLEKVVDIVKPSCLIGVCAQPAVFTPNVLRKMAQHNESPLIFPLSNPTSKAECTAEQAYVNTDGKCIFASGSPFDIFKYKNQTFIPGQGNNSYIFPGIALAVMACSVHTIPEETFLVAARALADQVTAEELAEGRIYPCLKKIQQVSVKIATKTAQYFFSEGLSTVRPEPEDKELFIRQHQYVYEYDH